NEGQIAGSFLGAFFAGIIALLSIRLTHKKNKEKEKLHNENVYCNRLKGIHSDLTSHQHYTDNLSKLLLELNRITNVDKKLPIKRVNPKLSLKFIDQCRLKLMEYDDCNVEILNKINHYLNSLNAIIADLDFSSILSLVEKCENEDKYVENTSEYIEVMLSNIEDLKVDRAELQEIVIKDLEHFPHKNKSRCFTKSELTN
ncbi:hypothetical protein KJ656_17295, partial [bacterium]|nr:hypothetical protein [bacterium]